VLRDRRVRTDSAVRRDHQHSQLVRPTLTRGLRWAVGWCCTNSSVVVHRAMRGHSWLGLYVRASTVLASRGRVLSCLTPGVARTSVIIPLLPASRPLVSPFSYDGEISSHQNLIQEREVPDHPIQPVLTWAVRVCKTLSTRLPIIFRAVQYCFIERRSRLPSSFLERLACKKSNSPILNSFY